MASGLELYEQYQAREPVNFVLCSTSALKGLPWTEDTDSDSEYLLSSGLSMLVIMFRGRLARRSRMENMTLLMRSGERLP